MAGSWNHIVLADSGKLVDAIDANKMLENGGDWWEFAEEAYGIVWFLALNLSGYDKETARSWIEDALLQHRRAIAMSPGVDGKFNPNFVEKPEDADY